MDVVNVEVVSGSAIEYLDKFSLQADYIVTLLTIFLIILVCYFVYRFFRLFF